MEQPVLEREMAAMDHRVTFSGKTRRPDYPVGPSLYTGQQIQRIRSDVVRRTLNTLAVLSFFSAEQKRAAPASLLSE
jgi:hypothetical protein